MSQLESTLKAMVACFDSLNIPYAVMGGLAVRVHGLPRPTNDVDFTMVAMVFTPIGVTEISRRLPHRGAPPDNAPKRTRPREGSQIRLHPAMVLTPIGVTEISRRSPHRGAPPENAPKRTRPR
jgi:hypothetical protein